MRGGAAIPRGEVLYRLVFEGTGIGLCVIESDGRILPNQAFADALGYRADEMLDTKWQELTHPEDTASVGAAIAALAAGKSESVRLVKRYLHKTGRALWGETIITAHGGQAGIPAFMIASILDVTERKRREEELFLRNTILATEHEAVPEGILVVSAQGRLVSHNQRFLEICKIPREIAASGDDDVLLAEAAKQVVDPQAFREQTEAIYRTPLAASHDEILLRSGRTIERSSVPMLTPEGENLGRLWCLRDVTESKQAAAVLRDRLSELERWQDVMLDREERVAELKQEVNELCVRLGQPPRYAAPEDQDDEASEAGPFKVTSTLQAVPEPDEPDGRGA